MAELTRTYGWDTTVLGPIQTWSELLLGSVNLMLCCRFPCVIFWGSEMIQFYNDDYLPLMSEKHPKALGQSARECWKEAWHIIGPQFEAALFEGKTTFQENVLVPVMRSGRLQDVYWTYSYSPIHESNGDIGGIIIVCQDKTGEILSAREHKRAERDLQTERQSLIETFHQAPAFIAVLRGPDHVIDMCNAAYLQLIGHPDVIGKSVLEAMPEVEAQGYVALLDQVYQTGKAFVSHSLRASLQRNIGKPQEERYLDFVYQPKREADGSVSGIIALGMDVTERRRAEQALIQSEQLAVVGRLASSIAHEINNPLESVTNLLYLARGEKNLSPELAGYLETAEQELLRVSRITSQTLSFYKQAAYPKAVKCEDMFASVLCIYQGRLVNSRIKVEKRKRATLPIVCFEGEIRQVLGNLIGNAIDAMLAEGGRLLLRSREATSWSTGRRGTMLTIADSGGGISDKHLKKIFEAFFTTKGAEGNGLGLWISTEIVDRHQGSLRVRSTQKHGGSGTVFTLFLPFNAISREVA